MRRFHFKYAFVGAALIGLVDTRSTVEAAHPPAPSPCAADGICRPNTTTWGHWNTHWRPWPGDKAALPTPAEAAAGPGEEKEDELRGFEPPLPQKEDQIGPEKEERAGEGPPTGAEPPAMPAAPAARPEPAGAAPDALPAIDPLGANHFRPMPPASVVLRSPAANQSAAQGSNSLPLPPSFHKQPSEVRSKSHSAAQKDDAPPALPASLLRVAQASRNRQSSRPHVRNDAHVRRTSAEAASGIRIINPAAAVVAEPGSEGLRQAIYLEEAGQGQSAE